MNYLPWVASIHDPPDLCLLRSSYDRREPTAPSSPYIVEEKKLRIIKQYASGYAPS
jgi:hypothetical protein